MNMKTNLVILLMSLLCWTGTTNAQAQREVIQTSQKKGVDSLAVELVVTGTVRDQANKNKLENVTVSLVGSSIGTVTNAEGTFSLKIPRYISAPQLEFSHLGYQNTRISVVSSTGKQTVVWMSPVSQQLKEVVVYGGDASHIVEEALKKVASNYPAHESLLSTFYRETIQKRHRYIGVSEAMANVYKTAYTNRRINRDKVQIVKARHLVSQKQSDTLAIKMVGGPNLSIVLDIVKNSDALLDQQSMNYYTFVLEPSALLDDRLQYVIRFEPCVILDYALFTGKLFIDQEKLSITRAEFSLDMSDKEKATSAILRKKPMGLRFRPQEVSFLVTYRERDGLTYLNYISNEIRFKCDWKKRLFSSTYTTRSEMVVVEQDENQSHVIAKRDAFGINQVFYDVVKEYWNEDFWKDYNIIEPTESLENAVKKLKKQ